MTRYERRRGAVRAVVISVAVVVMLSPLTTGRASGSDVTGRSGTDTALAPTASAVTVRGRGPYSDLSISVNQTRALRNQAVSVTWSGASQTIEALGAAFGSNYLQIMQCWGDDDGTVPDNPGPPPEQCAFGASNGVYGGVSGGPFPPGGLATERIVSRRGWPSYDPEAGTLDDRTGNVWLPFRAVDGTSVAVQTDPTYSPVSSGAYWQNPYFNVVNTNEVAGARTLPNGSGAEFFEVVTGIENAGLGCGQQVQPTPGGGTRVPRCWLVIVPRSDPTTENRGTPFGDSSGVSTSPLALDQWRHRISVPLEFNPVDTACKLGDDSARLVGNELIAQAISSWQPVLCARPGQRPFAYGVVSDAGARQQLLANVPGSPGMYVVSRPIDRARRDPTDPVVYAPLTLSGLTIAFNIERRPALDADDAAAELRSVRVATLNLTPRLVAKLLTQSYARQVTIKRAPDYPWLEDNPDHLGEDEDFLRFNPEFRELEPVWRKEFSGLLLPSGSSDAARQLWEYVLADPEARAWLDGRPDEWGMQVNPVYATTAGASSAGQPFAAGAPDSFPKADPYCYQAPVTPTGIVPPALCGTDWSPYAQSLRETARSARAATDGARLEENAFAASADRYYSRTPPQPTGSRTILALTDTASAELFGLQSASLSRAGDNGSQRSFVAPDPESLAAGVEGMVPSSDPAVLVADPTVRASGAYPLSQIAYAALRPLDLTTTQREEFASFVEYAAGEGQVSGPNYGQLPVGYAPLPDALASQAKVAARTIRELSASSETAAPGAGPFGFDDLGGSSSFADLASGAAVSEGVVGDSGGGSGDARTPPELALVRTPGVTVPASRFVLPGLAAAGLLERASRARDHQATAASRAGPGDGATVSARGFGPVGMVVMAAALAAGPTRAASASLAPAGGSAPPGAVVVVDPEGHRPLRGGGGSTPFTLALPEGAACPGDSVDGNYRVQSFLVPASVDPGEVVYQGLRPQVDGGWALYRADSATYVNQATDLASEPGGEGTIINVPVFSFAVFEPGMLPLGRAHIGLACSLFTRTMRYWSAEIELTADPHDPAGVAWTVFDPPAYGDGSGFPVAITAVAGGLLAAMLAWRARPSRHDRSSRTGRKREAQAP